MKGYPLVGKSIGTESRTGVGYSGVISYWKVFGRKIEGSSGGSDKVTSGYRVEMVEGLLTLGMDVVTVSAVTARDSAMRRCWWLWRMSTR